MHILVTGGGGFLGQALCRGLVERGHEVASFNRGHYPVLDALGVRQLRGDLADADALLHAITDALFGAAGLGDIGRHFSDTDPQYAGADSHALLAEAAQRVRDAGFEIVNVDSTIVAQAPKMAPHIPAMVQRIASALGIASDRVNVKAKTAERLGPVGEGRAIEARAVCLLVGREVERP